MIFNDPLSSAFLLLRVALLLPGLFTKTSLVVGTLLMITLMAGMCLLQKWDVVGLQMIYILLYVTLLFHIQFNRLSMDRIIFKK